MSRQHRKPKYEGDIRVVELATYTAPKIIEDSRKEFVMYGEDNNYYQYLIDIYNGSPTNHACINGISEMIFGKGIDALDSSTKPNEYAQMISLLNEDVIRKVVYDYYLMGGAAIQVIYGKGRKKIAQIEHIPVETLRAEKVNEDGVIGAYYYFSDWSKYKTSDEPKRISAFGTSKDPIEILFIKPYKAGYYYYSPPAYTGGLQYAELESEVANFHMNNIKNNLSPSMIINMNNGIPDEEQRSLIEKKIADKFTGSSNAGRFILSFNDNNESQATIEPIQLSDAHNQYQFLSTESQEKILVSHRIVSPMLLGVKNNTGLGNNADELEKASILMDNMVVRPFQNLILAALDKILAFNNITLKLYFKTLQPLEFTDLTNVTDQETREEETGQKLSLKKKEKPRHRTDNHPSNLIADDLISLGEDEDLDGWDLISEQEVDYDLDNKQNEMLQLTSTGSAKPNQKSDQDKGLFKVRYQYAPNIVSANTREFCRKMLAANKVYRKEDILSMDNKIVNAGWGPNGSDTYSVWFYKGGGSCQHFWMRKVYFRKRNNDGSFMKNDGLNNDKEISVNEARAEGFKPETNDPKVAKRPRDMKNRGFLKPKNFKTPK